MVERTKLTWKQVYKKFCIWSPEHAKMVIGYRPWGNNSIMVWLSNGQAYKVKYVDDQHFVMQMVSNTDIKKKLGLE